MNIQEVLHTLQNLTKTKITQTELGNALGKTRSDISLKAKRGTELKLSDIRKIEEYFKVDLVNTEVKQSLHFVQSIKKLADFEDLNNVVLDYYPDVFGSCGGGAFVFSENKSLISVPRDCFQSFSNIHTYSVINAIGDSMTPYINDKDKLIIQHWSGEQIQDNRVYVFRLGENLYVKRLVDNIDQIVIKSDNTIYPIRFLDKKECENMQIIGRIVGLMREV